MQIFGRKVTIKKAARMALTAARTVAVAREPLKVLRGYASMTSPEAVRLRSGHTIHMGGHPQDIVTFVVVFGRREYGTIPKDGVVIDIGANIGTFAVYAALNGAKKVYSFEPSPVAFAYLKKNIEANGLSDIIVPLNKAVADSQRTVHIPAISSPFNSIYSDTLVHGYDKDRVAAAGVHAVEAVTLPHFLQSEGIQSVDLLKMDCEGAEYEIVPSLDEDTLSKIHEIRMECHRSQKELVALFRGSQMRVIKGGEPPDLWLRNVSA
jgi:FkbM family methyltransferase